MDMETHINKDKTILNMGKKEYELDAINIFKQNRILPKYSSVLKKIGSQP